MTALLNNLAVGQTCDERFPDLPVGTAVCTVDADPLTNTVYVKQVDQLWQHRNNLTDARPGASFPDSSFVSENNYGTWKIAALPGVQVGHEFGGVDDLFRALPVGTCIQYRDWRNNNHYVKTADNEWQFHSEPGDAAGHTSEDRGFDTEGWRVWRLPEQDTEVRIPAASVQPGMYLKITERVRFFVLAVEGMRWTGVNFSTDGGEVPERYTRDGGAYTDYQVVAQDERLFAALAAMTTTSVDPQALRREGRDENERIWRERMERFNEAAKHLADQKGYCSDYDEFAEEWEEIGLTPRVVDREYLVTLEITGTVSTTVTMPENSEASEIYEAARDSIGIPEDSTWTINGETFNVTSVDDEDHEEV